MRCLKNIPDISFRQAALKTACFLNSVHTFLHSAWWFYLYFLSSGALQRFKFIDTCAHWRIWITQWLLWLHYGLDVHSQVPEREVYFSLPQKLPERLWDLYRIYSVATVGFSPRGIEQSGFEVDCSLLRGTEFANGWRYVWTPLDCQVQTFFTLWTLHVYKFIILLYYLADKTRIVKLRIIWRIKIHGVFWWGNLRKETTGKS